MIGLVPFLEAVVAFIVIAGTVEHGISLWLRHRASVSHPILLFQEGRNRHLDLAIWFQEVRFLRQPCRKFPLRTSSQGGNAGGTHFMPTTLAPSDSASSIPTSGAA